MTCHAKMAMYDSERYQETFIWQLWGRCWTAFFNGTVVNPWSDKGLKDTGVNPWSDKGLKSTVVNPWSDKGLNGTVVNPWWDKG